MNLNFSQDNITVVIQLTISALETLTGLANVMLTGPGPQLNYEEDRGRWHEMALPLKQLSETSWRLLLREVASDSLLHVLWCMKDKELA